MPDQRLREIFVNPRHTWRWPGGRSEETLRRRLPSTSRRLLHGQRRLDCAARSDTKDKITMRLHAYSTIHTLEEFILRFWGLLHLISWRQNPREKLADRRLPFARILFGMQKLLLLGHRWTSGFCSVQKGIGRSNRIDRQLMGVFPLGRFLTSYSSTAFVKGMAI